MPDPECPLLFAGIYFVVAPVWPGLIRLAVYLCAIPVILGLPPDIAIV